MMGGMAGYYKVQQPRENEVPDTNEKNSSSIKSTVPK